MSLISVDRLTRRLVKLYNNEEGLRLIVNSDTKEIFVVDIEMYHYEVASEILEMTKFDIKKRPYLASYLVSSCIDIANYEIHGVLTGFGSLEVKLAVSHTKNQLKSAHGTVLDFIDAGQLSRSNDYKEKITLPKKIKTSK